MKSKKKDVTKEVWNSAIAAGLINDETENIEDYRLVDHRSYAPDISGMADLREIADGIDGLVISQPQVLDGTIMIEFDHQIQDRFKQYNIDWNGDVAYLLEQLKALLTWADLKIESADLAARTV